jgi:hypothetical protein
MYDGVYEVGRSRSDKEDKTLWNVRGMVGIYVGEVSI